MPFRYTSGVLVVGLLASAPMGAFAQGQRPVAVPIVGSPAAGQPTQTPGQPPLVIPAERSRPAPPPVPAAASSPNPAIGASRGPRKLELSFKDGAVSLDAQNVTIREILAEWQRRDGCQFVNADKLPSSPITIQFPAGTPELEVIDSLLRGLATPTSGYGYIVAPGSGQNASVCGAVYIVASSRPTSAANYVPAAAPVAAPVMNGSPDSELPPVVPFMPPGQPQAYPGAVPPGQQPVQQNAPPRAGSNAAPPQPGGIWPPMPAAPPAAAPQSPGFGPIAPTAPGASGRFGAPSSPAPAPAGNGRGGQ